MIRIALGARFEDDASRLPKKTQDKLARLLVVLRANPHDPRLHTKKLGPPLDGQFSFRITRDWRVIFWFVGTADILVARVKHRKDIYR